MGRERPPSPIGYVIAVVYNESMKLTLQTQLLPDRDHAARLKATVERFNEAANWAAGVAFEHRCSSKAELQKIVYRDLRERFGLSAQIGRPMYRTGLRSVPPRQEHPTRVPHARRNAP